MGKVFGFYFILLLFTITFTSFAALSDVNENEFDSYRTTTMAVTCLVCIVALYNICNDAHFISNVVSLLILFCTLQILRYTLLIVILYSISRTVFLLARWFHALMYRINYLQPSR
jgi:hypothetical protein